MAVVRLSELLIFLAISVAGILMLERAKKGKVPYLKKLAALDAIEAAVGRATEMGRPVLFAPGNSKDDPGVGLTGFEAAQNLAGLAVLDYVARLTAKYGAPLMVAIKNPEIAPIIDTICMLAYRSEGKEDQYKSDTVRFCGMTQMSFMIGYMGLIYNEKPGANIMIGAMYGESLVIASAGREVGAMQVGGTARPAQATFFVALCDYSIMGEEIFAAGAYVSRDPKQIGTIAGQDISKFIAVALVVLGAIFATAGLGQMFSRYLQMII